MKKIQLSGNGVYDLGGDALSQEIKELSLECIRQQKAAAVYELSQFQPCSQAEQYISEQALVDILESGVDIHGIASDRSISNVISYGAKHINDSVLDAEVNTLRAKVDLAISKHIETIFETNGEHDIISSGHLWYPPGSYMGWHTNSKVPGWRVYINYAEEEGKSFFRYYDNNRKKYITLHDQYWNLRVFKITDSNPLWHCVYSDTNRFSLGYMLKSKPRVPILERCMKKIRSIF